MIRIFPLVALVALGAALLPSPALGQSCSGGYCGGGDGEDPDVKVQVHVTVTITPEDAGTVLVNGEELEDGVFTARQGDILELEAIPDSDYTFDQWSDWFEESSSCVEAPIYNHKTLTAHFTEVTEQPARAASDDVVVLAVPDGTTALDGSGDALAEVSVGLRLPRALPSSAVLIGDVHDYEPDGATFDPPLLIALPYDIDSLPADVPEEELAIAVFDADTQDWTVLPSVVNTEDQVVETMVSHFSEFAVVAPMLSGTTPLITPGFSFSSLSVAPVDPYAGQDVSVTVLASYVGFNAQARSRVFVLMNGEVADETEIVLSPGDHVPVTLTVSPGNEGACELEVNGLVQTVMVAGSPPESALSEAVALAEEEGFEPMDAAESSLLSRMKPVALIAAGLVALLLIGPLISEVRRRILRYRYDL